jgi:dTDP-glucose 4,6-dehydratase
LTHEKNTYHWSCWITSLRPFYQEGYFVIGMDNLITGDLKNIEHLFKLENFEFYHHDITKFVHVPGQLVIFFISSPASPIDYLKIPIQTLK